jgi:hypothetical protein
MVPQRLLSPDSSTKTGRWLGAPEYYSYQYWRKKTMEITVETFLKPNPQAESEAAGRTTLVIDENAFLALEKAEELYAVRDQDIDVDLPSDIGALKEENVRIFLSPGSEAGHFHLVARRAEDDALVYTEPAMIRLVAA